MEMNSRERVLAAINHQPVDRVPTDIWATPEVWTKLKAHFGTEDTARISALLHIDGLAGVGPKYVGPPLPACPPGEEVDVWGIRRKKVDYGTGEYSEMTLNPLAEARAIHDLDKYNWPRADWWDYSGMKAAAQAVHDKKVVACGYMAPFYYHNLTRGLELSLMDPLLEPELTREIVRRISEFFLDHHRRMFEAADGLIDTTQVTDDLGTQHGPMISLDIWRTCYKPWMKRCIDLAHGFGIKVFHHDDGAIRAFIPELVEMGIDILNPIQWRCPGMDRAALKRDFGRRLCFHGAVDNQQTLPFSSADEVRREVRENIAVLAADKTGYILAPCHNIQAVTPVENIVAMYDEAWQSGKL